MVLEKRPFELHKERTEDLKAVKYPIHLNQEDIMKLQKVEELMQEEKMGSVIKNLMNIGITTLLNDPVMQLAWQTAFKKKANNERLGIVAAEVNFEQKYTKYF